MKERGIETTQNKPNMNAVQERTISFTSCGIQRECVARKSTHTHSAYLIIKVESIGTEVVDGVTAQS